MVTWRLSAQKKRTSAARARRGRCRRGVIARFHQGVAVPFAWRAMAWGRGRGKNGSGEGSEVDGGSLSMDGPKGGVGRGDNNEEEDDYPSMPNDCFPTYLLMATIWGSPFTDSVPQDFRLEASSRPRPKSRRATRKKTARHLLLLTRPFHTQW